MECWTDSLRWGVYQAEKKKSVLCFLIPSSTPVRLWGYFKSSWKNKHFQKHFWNPCMIFHNVHFPWTSESSSHAQISNFLCTEINLLIPFFPQIKVPSLSFKYLHFQAWRKSGFFKKKLGCFTKKLLHVHITKIKWWEGNLNLAISNIHERLMWTRKCGSQVCKTFLFF